jgi:hypothetical protein
MVKSGSKGEIIGREHGAHGRYSVLWFAAGRVLEHHECLCSIC